MCIWPSLFGQDGLVLAKPSSFFRLLLTKMKSRSIKMQNRTRPTSVIFLQIVIMVSSCEQNSILQFTEIKI